MASQTRTLGFRYDRTTIVLHWLVAALVVLQWVGGRTIDWFPKGPLKIDARSVHITLGAALALAVAYRLYWRAFRAARRPVSPEERWRPLVVGAHWTLLAVLVGLVGLGLVLEGLRGDSFFNLARLPALGPYGPAERHLLANQVTTVHGLAANLILAMAGLHAAAALVHDLLLKDRILRRML